MAVTELSNRNHRSADSALEVLEVFSEAAQMTFDRILASRVLGEAERAVAGDDAQAWARRLVDVGEVLNLRVRYLERTLREACTFVRQGIPVAFCEENVDGRLRWSMLTEAKGRRIRLTPLPLGDDEQWVSVGRLRKLLGLPSSKSRGRWVIGQAAFACQLPQALSAGLPPQQTPTPLARLIGLIRPEKKDLWVVLIFSLVVGVLALASPVAVEALVNTVAFGRYLQPVVVLALLLFVFLSFAAAMRGLITYVVEIVQRRLFVRVVEDLAYRLPRVQQNEYDSRYAPELVNRFFDVVTVQKTASALLLDGISIVLQTVIGMAVLAFYHPFLLGFNVVLIASIGFVVFVLGRGAVATAIRESGAKYAVESWLEELARHPTAFKLHAGSQFGLDRADQLTVKWLDARRAHFRVVMRQILFALGLQAFAATALLGLGGWLVILGELTLGQLVAAELIVMMIVGSFAKLGKHMESFYDLLAAVNKLGVLFDLTTEPRERLFHLVDGTPARLSLRDVSYKYNGEFAMRDLTLNLERGETVAVVGPAGSGKSTLIDLLCGLRSPSEGHIELDGIDLRQIRPDSLREHLAVARRVEIFHGTIEENVHLNRTNIRADDVRQALDDVDLLDEVLRIPQGLDTVLQTEGTPLASSQCARLMLARAIVGRPRLLLIDGVLDVLDDETIPRIMQRLTQNGVPWTVLVATGRETVRRACDRTITLDPAKVAGGRHESTESH